MKSGLLEQYAHNVKDFKILETSSWRKEENAVDEILKKTEKNLTVANIQACNEIIDHAKLYLHAKKDFNPNHPHNLKRTLYLENARTKAKRLELDIYLRTCDESAYAYQQASTKENLMVWQNSIAAAKNFIKNMIYMKDDPVCEREITFKTAKEKYDKQHSLSNWCLTFFGCKDETILEPKTTLDTTKPGPDYMLMM